MKLQIKSYPLNIAKEILKLERKISEVFEANKDIVSQEVKSYFSFKDNDPNSAFFFEITVPKLNSKNEIEFLIHRSPSNENKVSMKTVIYPIHEVLPSLNSWINLIREYNNLPLSEEDSIQKFYEKEFYAEFEIVDDNSETEPFSSPQQEKLNLILSKLVERLELLKNTENISDVISNINELKVELPISNKKKVVKKLSKIFGQLKKLGVDILKDLLKEGLKEGLKYLLTQGIQHI